jgi:putative flippase GtrA
MTSGRFGVPIRFLIVGAINTAAGLVTIYLCKWLLQSADLFANVYGYAVGLTISFLLNRGWTFRHSGHMMAAISRFLAIFALAYISNLLAVLVALRGLGMNSYLSQAIGVVPYTLIFYLGSRHYVFGSPGHDPT